MSDTDDLDKFLAEVDDFLEECDDDLERLAKNRAALAGELAGIHLETQNRLDSIAEALEDANETEKLELLKEYDRLFQQMMGGASNALAMQKAAERDLASRQQERAERGGKA